jgi:hypothetical protein
MRFELSGQWLDLRRTFITHRKRAIRVAIRLSAEALSIIRGKPAV